MPTVAEEEVYAVSVVRSVLKPQVFRAGECVEANPQTFLRISRNSSATQLVNLRSRVP